MFFTYAEISMTSDATEVRKYGILPFVYLYWGKNLCMAFGVGMGLKLG